MLQFIEICREFLRFIEGLRSDLRCIGMLVEC